MWPVDWANGETITEARLTEWTDAIQTWGGDVSAGGNDLTNCASVRGETATHTLGLWTNSVQRVWVTATGEVGIGAVPSGGINFAVNKNADSLTYLDIINPNTGGSAGAITRYVTSDSAGTGTATVDMVKYKTGGFVINNSEASAAAASVTLQTGATCSLQLLGTGKIRITLPPAYANNAAAVAGGLVSGMMYRTGGDPDTICVVH